MQYFACWLSPGSSNKSECLAVVQIILKLISTMEKVVLRAAKTFIVIGAFINPKVSNMYNKLVGVFLQVNNSSVPSSQCLTPLFHKT